MFPAGLFSIDFVRSWAQSAEVTMMLDNYYYFSSALVGWKGRSSKGVVALQRLVEAGTVTEELWNEIRTKLREEAADQQGKAGNHLEKCEWIDFMREDIERKIGMPFRTSKDHIWEYAVALDHALAGFREPTVGLNLPKPRVANSMKTQERSLRCRPTQSNGSIPTAATARTTPVQSNRI